MALNPEKKHDNVKEMVQKERRGFLKKTAYAAPTIIALGGLLKPRDAKADDFDRPPSDPDTSVWQQ